MPFNRPKPYGAKRRRRERLAAAIVWTDRALSFVERWAVPGLLGFLLLSGPLLSASGGGLTPYAGLRSLHALAGLGLVLAAVYRVLAWLVRGLGAFRRWVRLWRQEGRRPATRWPNPARAGLVGGHGLLLAMMLWTGIERYIGQRWGLAVAPVLSATEWSLAHRLLAPYYVAALLLLWFFNSRIAWRALLDQLRRP